MGDTLPPLQGKSQWLLLLVALCTPAFPSNLATLSKCSLWSLFLYSGGVNGEMG